MDYDINLRKEKLLKALIVISCPVLTIILSTRFYITGVIIGAAFSLLISIFIMFGNNMRITKVNKRKCILSTIISCYMMKVFLSFYNFTIQEIAKNSNIGIYIIETILGICSLPVVIFIVYKFIDIFIPKIKIFFMNLSGAEIEYLHIILIVSIIVSFFTIHSTTAFTKPGNIDVIYTSDSFDMLIKDVYCNVSHNENDIRQPLFGFFSLPFGILARLISEFVFFVPDNYEYEFVMTIFQFLITTITTILIARLLKVEEKDKKYIYILFSFSFPYIVFNLVLEQYVIALFYLILTIYMFCNNDGTNYAYIGATGTLVTSGILLPLITKFKNKKQYIKDFLESFIIFTSIFLISGQFSQLTFLTNTMTSLMSFAKPVPIIDKIYQFLNFVQGIFFSCKG